MDCIFQHIGLFLRIILIFFFLITGSGTLLRAEQLDIQLLEGTIDFDGYVNEQACRD